MKSSTFVSVVLAMLLFSCTGPKRISTIESTSYNGETNRTTLSVLPYGTVSMKGRWKKTAYNNVSGQHNFSNSDTLSSAIAINPASAYPFYKKGMTSNQIVKSLYEWDSEYMVKQINGTRTVLQEDTTSHYIIWQIKADNQNKVDMYYLFGSENGIIFSVYISTEKWSPAEKTSFLLDAYNNKTVGSCCE